MTPVVILAAIVLTPVVLMMVLRVNAALIFLSLCLGDVLVRFVSRDAHDLLGLFSAAQPNRVIAIQNTNGNIKLALLLLPVLLTTIFMIRTVHGHGRFLLNILPSAGVGLLGVLLIVPLLPTGLSHNITSSNLWLEIQRTQGLIVGVSALICLLVVWQQRPKTGGGKHSKHVKTRRLD